MILPNPVVCALCSKEPGPDEVLQHGVICNQCARDLFNLHLVNRNELLSGLRKKAFDALSQGDYVTSALLLYQRSFYRDKKGGFSRPGWTGEESKAPIYQESEGPKFGDRDSYMLMVPNLPKSIVNFVSPEGFENVFDTTDEALSQHFDEEFTSTYATEILLAEELIESLKDIEVLEDYAEFGPKYLLAASNFLLTIPEAFIYHRADLIKARFKSLEILLTCGSPQVRLGAGIAIYETLQRRSMAEWAKLGWFELVPVGGSQFESRLRYFDYVQTDAKLFMLDLFDEELKDHWGQDDSIIEMRLYDLQGEYLEMIEKMDFYAAFEVHFKILMILKEAPASEFPNLTEFRNHFAKP